MRATTDYSDSLIPTMSLDSPSDNAMMALYRVALGPVNTERYLSIFARFDATGRTTTHWNWAASLCTLNWMVFRQVWGAALVYVAAAEGLALLVFALGRSFLQWPQGVEWGVVGAFALLAFTVPGLYGDAILHTEIRKRVARALAASRTVPDACALLERQASSRRRLHMLLLINLVLAGIAALAFMAMPQGGLTARSWGTAVTVADAASAAASAPAPALAAPSPAPSAVPPAAAPPIPAEQTPPAPPAPSATQEPPAAIAPPQPPAATPTTPPVVSSAASPATPETTPPQAQAPSASAPAPAAAPAAPASTSPRAAAAAKTASAARPAPPAKAAAAPAASAPASAAPTPVGTAPGYYINVGLFADEANARKAQARLLNEGLPAFRQEIHGANGRRIRVRVGPYPTKARADAAAATIRAMSLEAVVFKQ